MFLKCSQTAFLPIILMITQNNISQIIISVSVNVSLSCFYAVSVSCLVSQCRDSDKETTQTNIHKIHGMH